MTSDDWLRGLVLVAAYLFGGLSPGHWLVRRRTGADVRAQGSGGTGATNAGRVLGRGAFVAVLMLDAAKGALPIVLARLAGWGDAWLGALAFAVVAGHIFPVHLGFRGGRGVATAAGAWLALDFRLLLVALGGTLLAYPFLRRFSPSGLAGICLAPAAVVLWGGSPPRLGWTIAAVLLLLWAHRAHIKTLFSARTKG